MFVFSSCLFFKHVMNACSCSGKVHVFLYSWRKSPVAFLQQETSLLIWKDQFLCNEKCAYIPPHLYFLHQMEDSKQGITDIYMMLNCMVQKCGGKKFRFAHWSGLGPWSSLLEFSSCKNFPQTAKDIAQFRGGVRKTISFSLLVF